MFGFGVSIIISVIRVKVSRVEVFGMVLYCGEEWVRWYMLGDGIGCL